jgi:hypothetical protein
MRRVDNAARLSKSGNGPAATAGSATRRSKTQTPPCPSFQTTGAEPEGAGPLAKSLRFLGHFTLVMTCVKIGMSTSAWKDTLISEASVTRCSDTRWV